MEIRECNNPINEKWDAFVERSPGGSFEQTSVWQNARKKAKYKTLLVRLMFFENEDIVGGCQIVIRSYPLIGRIGVVNRGPVVLPGYEHVAPEIVDGLSDLISKQHLRYIAIDVDYKHSWFSEFLNSSSVNSVEKFEDWPPYIPSKGTLLLDLLPSVDSIFADFHPSRRKNIRLGLKFDFDTRVGDRSDIPIFFNLMKNTCSRRKSVPLVDDLDYFLDLWDLLHPQKRIMLHFAVIGDEVICAQLAITFRDTYYAIIWGWNGAYGKQNITETFLWKNMLLAKEMGFHYYDCGQIIPEIADYILNTKNKKAYSDAIPKHPMYGMTDFKMKWGGSPIFHPKAYVLFKNKFSLKFFLFFYRILFFILSRVLLFKRSILNK